jgi:hypothetical protein
MQKSLRKLVRQEMAAAISNKSGGGKLVIAAAAAICGGCCTVCIESLDAVCVLSNQERFCYYKMKKSKYMRIF